MKEAALIGTGITTGIAGLSTTASAESDWTCRNCDVSLVESSSFDMPHDDDAQMGEVDSKIGLHWFGSDYVGGDHGWLHDFAVSGGGAIEYNRQGVILAEYFHGQKYKIRGTQGEMRPNVSNDDHGVKPDGEEGSLDDWGGLLLEQTIGTLASGAGWFLAVDKKLRKKMGPADGFDFGVPDGIAYRNTKDYWDSGWYNCAFYHRFQYESDQYDPQLIIEAALQDRMDVWSTVKFVTTPRGDPGGEPKSVPSTMSRSERNELGIRDVSDRQITRVIDGEEYKVKYRLENAPYEEIEVTKDREY